MTVDHINFPGDSKPKEKTVQVNLSFASDWIEPLQRKEIHGRPKRQTPQGKPRRLTPEVLSDLRTQAKLLEAELKIHN